MAHNKEKADAPMKRRGGMRRRRKFAYSAARGIVVIDFKDTAKLRKYISERRKTLPERITGTCAKHQQKLLPRLSSVQDT